MKAPMVLVVLTTAVIAESGLAEEYITRKSSNEFTLIWSTTDDDKYGCDYLSEFSVEYIGFPIDK